ncbi:hypothetical protein BV25DRAFT_1297034 [Artomyces pyxidatus]|uniref:Uncharacterized protein n=1 Tax=Artomyces pyxidatus TaxID=48021 RepID=A0ACB8SNL8_9AGAM|nr:hypothetical protein BV25DRAFT_1297034 [Artomyces pyxidatus]
MFPVKTNIRVQGAQVEVFALRRQIVSFQPPDNDPTSDKLTRGRAARRRRGDAGSPSAERQPDKGASPPPPSDVPAAKLASVRSELELTRGDLSRSQAEAAKLAEQCQSLERALREVTDALRAREMELVEMRKEAAERRLQLDELKADRKPRARSGDREHRLRYETRRQNGTHSPSGRTAHDSDDDTGHLRVRPFHGRRPKSTPPAPRSALPPVPPLPGAEVAPGLEVFLTKIDHWSGAQVIEAIQDLNSEILQLAASATELTTVVGRGVAPPMRLNQAGKGVSTRLGQPFAHILATRDHDHDPTLIQFALQACVATCTARLLSVFCIGLPIPPNELFAQLHFHMHSTEPQATSSRWRALTLSHIRTLNPRLSDVAIQDFVLQILRAWADIFVLCGCATTEPLDALRARFGAQAQRIALSACGLARVISEEIMSTNFEVILIEQGRAFDAATMANAFAGYGPSTGAVLCTTELGLRCSTRKNAKAVADGLVGESIERTTLLLPKVILETVPQILDHMSEAIA